MPGTACRYNAAGYENADICACAPSSLRLVTCSPKPCAFFLIRDALRSKLVCRSLHEHRMVRWGAQLNQGLVHGRWTFGNALYPAGNYKGMANLKWTCKSPCTSRNYLIQVPLRPAESPVVGRRWLIFISACLLVVH